MIMRLMHTERFLFFPKYLVFQLLLLADSILLFYTEIWRWIRMLELEQLNQLVAIADSQTISAAAEKLHLSQPALTRAMQRLERELGVNLFYRKKNRLGLNPTGEMAVGYARILLKDAEAFSEQIKIHAARISTVSIGSCSPAPMWYLAANLGMQFSEYTLKTEIKCEDDLKEGLSEDRYQIVILKNHPADEAILAYPFAEETLSVEIPSNHPFAIKGSATFAELANYPVLTLREPTVWRDILQSYGIHIIFQDDPTILNDLKWSSGLLSMNSNLAQRWIEPTHGRVVVPITDSAATAVFYACTTKQHANLLDCLTPLKDE